jgi:hypothetical protein
VTSTQQIYSTVTLSPAHRVTSLQQVAIKFKLVNILDAIKASAHCKAISIVRLQRQRPSFARRPYNYFTVRLKMVNARTHIAFSNVIMRRRASEFAPPCTSETDRRFGGKYCLDLPNLQVQLAPSVYCYLPWLARFVYWK